MRLSDRIGRRVKLHELHVLMATVQAGSMSKAAAVLNTTQPAISKTIADLEHSMGVQLLDRSAQGVEPTQYGRALLKHSVAAFDELKQGVNEIEFLADPTVGEIRIGSTEPLAAGILPAIIDRLNRNYPRVTFHVAVQADFATLQRELRSREIDLMVGRSLEPLSEDMESEVLFTDRLLFVAGLRSRWANRRKIKLSELIDEPWALPPSGSIPRSLIVDAFRAAGVQAPRAIVSGFTIPLHMSLLATGRFLAVLPESLMHFSVDLPIKVLPVEMHMKLSPVVVVTLANRTHSPVVKLFLDCARDVGKSLAIGKQRSGAPTGPERSNRARNPTIVS